MRKNPVSQSGLFNPRILIVFALCSVGALLAMLSFAATPPNGMTGAAVNSPGNSPLAEKTAGPLSANANAAAAGSWAIVNSPNTSSSQPNYLVATSCATATDCWAVGYYDPGSGLDQTLIEQWKGTSWSIVTSPNTSATQNNFLNGITCASASDCWAFGYYYNGSVNQTLTEHFTPPPVQLASVVSELLPVATPICVRRRPSSRSRTTTSATISMPVAVSPPET